MQSVHNFKGESASLLGKNGEQSNYIMTSHIHALLQFWK